MKISVQSNLEPVRRQLGALRGQVPFVTSVAINDVARKAQAATPSLFERVLDRPKPFTTKSAVFVKFSNKASLEATVGLKDIQARYLAPLLSGEERRQKPVEQKFMGRYFVPGNGLQLDAYGNVPKATLLAIVRAVTSGAPIWKGRRVFVVPDGQRLPAGVYAGDKAKAKKRQNKAEPLLIFAKRAPRYKKVLDFVGEVERVVRTEFPSAFERALRRAMETAR